MIILKKNCRKPIVKTKKEWNKMKKGFRTLKAQLRLGYGLTFALISLLFVMFLFLGIKSLMLDQIGQSRLDVLKQISERSNTIKSNTITISNLYRYDEHMRNYLSEEEDQFGERRQKAINYLDELKETYDQVFHDIGLNYDVVILGNNGFQYSSRGKGNYDFQGLESQLWYRQSYDSEDDMVFISSFQEKFDSTGIENSYVFGAFRQVMDQEGNILGTILVNIDEKYLEGLYSSVEENSNFYIFDKKGNIVSSRDKNLLGKNFIGVKNFRQFYGINQYNMIRKLGQDYLLSNYYDPETGWTIVEEMPCSVIFKPLHQAIAILLLLLSFCIFAGAGAAYYLSGRISKPIQKLCSLMDQVRQGDFDVISDIKGYEEVNQLKDSFNEMAKEIKKLMESVKQKEIKKRKSELDFLRAQINPHFLYNTLFSIQCMIELGNNKQAVLMMSAFIDLLKRTLSVDTDFILLEEEFENTKKYLVLQQIRYGDKVHFECEIEEMTKGCLVPSLIIQPIVENAIFHGLNAKEEPGLIVVESAICSDCLLITISDDGVGQSEEELMQLRNQLEDREYHTGGSIGILNVLNRIRINFGDSYGLLVESESGIGTTVTLKLPVIRKERFNEEDLA
ncbi:sensor histidine kinase [Lacrimispora sp.]|uniref:sensor histidine kinase n=1 Tax=Lacrimispora sp. TaxID=2719234 RepID=UPI0028AB8692|nr:sensor histidine kinase [Lacrimispora sp.]